MTIYLRTRTRRTDYSFLGKAPAQFWWSKFGRSTAFERPSVIVLRHPDGRLQGCFSGIESPSRLDRVGTIIRYTVVVEDDEQSILALTQACLLKLGGVGPDLGQVLDGCFRDDGEIEDLLVDDPAVEQEVSQRVKKALSKYEAASAQDRADWASSHWMASPNLLSGCEAFMGRVQCLVRKERHGLAALLNLIRSPDEAQALAKCWGSLALLLSPGSNLDLDDIEELAGALPLGSAALPSPASAPQPARGISRARTLAVLAALGLLALLTWLASGRSTTSEVSRVPAPASVR